MSPALDFRVTSTISLLHAFGSLTNTLQVSKDSNDGKCSSRTSRDLRAFVEARSPPNVQSRELNVGWALSQYLTGYQARLRSKRAKLNLTGGRKPLSLYLLTDGCFQERSNLMGPIKEILNTIQAESLPSEHVGIQLLRFGHDIDGAERLEKLDRFAREEGLWT